MLLFRRNDAAMDFDFALVKEQTRDNPVFYVQYAHARCAARSFGRQPRLSRISTFRHRRWRSRILVC
jgi:hypothetical protein